MRASPVLSACVVLMASAGAARAESFVEIAGGLMTPISDDQWKDYVEPGPKLGARVGSVGDKVGGMLMLDWTPINADDAGFGDAVDISSHRIRVQVAATSHQKLGANATASFRIGAGIDIAYVSVETSIFGFMSESSDTDVGLALEPAAGLWFSVGSMQVGGELALPISFHDDGPDNDVDLEDYTSLDLDILFGVRFLSP